ncbi:hypothetical protein CAPI_03290 [Corynebacterium capitovis DSM 44611]|uniref:type II toxin-antitoxin system PemK/MazF family toxin n=1 Tax=Corynebacterium capitovis TaxID=131081 RepID=UPI00036DBD3F|nr:type II toxin-antitoxin system PemK/MazF family toxin [Corynebacterium capitovis]WKD57220.1 hypothetical protein CAPI_03290 [Corynebacterium capitovis DSM 44611]
MLFRRSKRHRSSALDQGLALLNERLGSTPRDRSHKIASQLLVKPTAKVARSIYYAPDMDGQAEPGEVVWVTVPTNPPQERSLVVVGREHRDVLGLLISPEEDHPTREHWLGIGSGEWEYNGNPCWVRLDKTVMVPESELHRRGTYIPPRRFERIANRLRDHFDWV